MCDHPGRSLRQFTVILGSYDKLRPELLGGRVGDAQPVLIVHCVRPAPATPGTPPKAGVSPAGRFAIKSRRSGSAVECRARISPPDLPSNTRGFEGHPWSSCWAQGPHPQPWRSPLLQSVLVISNLLHQQSKASENMTLGIVRKSSQRLIHVIMKTDKCQRCGLCVFFPQSDKGRDLGKGRHTARQRAAPAPRESARAPLPAYPSWRGVRSGHICNLAGTHGSGLAGQ